MREEIRVLVATVSRKCCELLGESFEEFRAKADPDQYIQSTCPQCGDDTWLGVKSGALVASGEAEQLCILCTRTLAGDSEPVTPIDQVPKITCPKCGKTSYNPTDVAQKYCGNCHQFHDLMR